MHPTSDLHQRVAAAVDRIRRDDPQGIWDLHELARPALRGMLAAEARRVGAWLGRDDLESLAVDAILALVDVIGPWRPGGALPWRWGRHRVLAVVHQHLGTFTRPLDEEVEALPAPPVVATVDESRAALRSLAARHAGARQLEEQLAALPERHGDLWLAFQMEKGSGNSSPAVTVGAEQGMQPAAVRKAVQRVNERLAA